MDEVGARIQQQSSLNSESNSEEQKLESTSLPLDKRICLVGAVIEDSTICTVAQSFGVPVVTSKTGEEYVNDHTCSTVFVLNKFEGESYDLLYKSRHPLLGPPALQQLANKKEKLPNNTRPLYSLAMSGVVVCFTGFRNKDDLTTLVPLVHHMGGSIRKDVTAKVTHLIANVSGGEKYQYAATFKVPIMHLQWVLASWECKDDVTFRASADSFVNEHRLKPFYGTKVSFVGFPEEEEKHMTEVLEANGGTLISSDDSACTHVVVDESTIGEKIEGPPKAHIIKAEWFWTSVQKGVILDEKDYLFGDYIDLVVSPNARRDSHQATPGSASRRKRKRLQDTLTSLVHQPSPVSGSFLDCTPSPAKPSDICEPTIADTPRKGLTPRQQVFLELVQTESNYVNILGIIMTMFKKQLENSTEEEALLNNTELRIIFGNLPPIFETHSKMLEELRWTSANWSEDKSIGNIILKYSQNLLKAYPPFINFFEETKCMLSHCDSTKPRFHAFLKACQTKPECGRQSLQELLIRPVQRLPSISLLLNDILKHTPKGNVDNSALEKALASIREVMTHINEDKRKTEGQRVMFDIFNEIDNCPPDLVSSHRSFIAKSEVIQLSSSEGLSSKGNPLVLFLFSDQLEVCKKRSKAFNTLKSPNTVNGIHKNPSIKPYKHIKLMSLSTIKKVIDIEETDECQRVFSIVFRNNDEIKERLCSFAMTDEEMDKGAFLKTLCKQMATNACTADADKFLAYLEPHQLNIDTSDVNNGTLSRAFKFATKTRLRVGRAFSFNKTPSMLKRALSSMMSPFGSSTNLTPALELGHVRAASYDNISELTNADKASGSPPHTPMSGQPTRKLKMSSLGTNALKRL